MRLFMGIFFTTLMLVAWNRHVVIPPPDVNADSSRVVRIALLVPFSVASEHKKKPGTAGIIEIATAYYQGFTLACDSLKKMGIDLQLWVYDTRRDSLTTLKILKRPEFKSMDAVFGPYFKEGIEMVSSVAQTNGFVHVAPTPVSELKVKAPRLIRTQPTALAYAQQLVQLMAKRPNETWVWVDDDKNPDRYFSKQCLNYVESNSPKAISHVTVGIDFAASSLTGVTPNTRVNLILSSKSTTVQGRLWKALEEDSLIEIWASPELVEASDPKFAAWEKCHLHVLSIDRPMEVDSRWDNLKKYLHQALDEEPSEYVIKGFEQALSIIPFIQQVGRTPLPDEFELPGVVTLRYANKSTDLSFSPVSLTQWDFIQYTFVPAP